MLQYELESELDREFEFELESEYESEEFLSALFPILKVAAPYAIKAVGSLLGSRRRRPQRELEFEYEGESENEEFIGGLLRSAASALGLGESEWELEAEFESFPASEYEMVMNELAYRAAHSESEAEAEAFLGSLVPFVTRAVRGIAAATPTLIQGVSSIGKALYQQPSTRQLLQTVPDILKGAVTNLAEQRAQGTPLSREGTLRALASSTASVLKSPRKTTRAIKQTQTVRAGGVQGARKPRANGGAKRRRP